MKFHKRQSSRRLLGGLSAEVQSLESRCLPAGTVTADISGGNITLNGDKFNNLIEVELTPTGVFVRGVEGTNLKFGARTIADGSSLKLASGPRVTTDLIINLKDGNDSVSIYVGGSAETPVAATIGRNLKIDVGRGMDSVVIDVRDGSLTIGNELNIKLGDDSDSLLLGYIPPTVDQPADLPEVTSEILTFPLHVAGLTKISGGTGDDVVGAFGVSTGRNLQIETGGGNDAVVIGGASIGGSATISTGSGNDGVGLAFVAILGDTDIKTGSGDDRVVAFFVHSEGNATILLQQGNDTVITGGQLSLGNGAQLTLNGGTGARTEIDTLAVAPDVGLELVSTVIGFEDAIASELVPGILEDLFREFFGSTPV